MAERMKTFAMAAIAALAALLVVTALIVTGGPLQARKEHRDQIRRSDLSAISRSAQCQANTEKSGPPAVLTAYPGCGELPRLQDPFTGADYDYQVLDATTLRLCAGFELPFQDGRWYIDQAISRQPGCLDFQIVQNNPDS